ncbi:MAG: four helix bundle protein [Victivallaceae bacterium]|nr:four helix bundle protein [Victivallaceae bacterium]MDD4180539.1 four helix bundle protein [Victivallaceae bacterium]
MLEICPPKTPEINMSYQSFEELEVWKRACRLSVDIYKVLKDSKDFSFKNQMQRAAISIASNIAEGAERNSIREYIHFLHIAKGSAGELRTQIYIADKVKLIESEKRQKLCTELTEISKMLQGLIKFLTAQLD